MADRVNEFRALAAEQNNVWRELGQAFDESEFWVELTPSGFVKVADDGWVYAYTKPDMLPGGLLEGFRPEDGLDVEAIRMTGQRLRGQVAEETGIVVDYGHRGEYRAQIPLVPTEIPRD